MSGLFCFSVILLLVIWGGFGLVLSSGLPLVRVRVSSTFWARVSVNSLAPFGAVQGASQPVPGVKVLSLWRWTLGLGLTILKLWIYFPALFSEGKSCSSCALIQSVHGGGLFTDGSVVVRERERKQGKKGPRINAPHANLQWNQVNSKNVIILL